MTIEIDWTRCDGHGLCTELLPEQIARDEWGFPILLGNKLRGNTYGVEITARYQVLEWWRLAANYTNLQKNLSLEPGSTDRSGGAQELIETDPGPDAQRAGYGRDH
jgi:hypothetical protein